MGDKTVSCGTPHDKSHTDDSPSPTATLCVQSVRNDLNQSKAHSLTPPSTLKYFNKMTWSVVLKAADKCSRSNNEAQPLSTFGQRSSTIKLPAMFPSHSPD